MIKKLFNYAKGYRHLFIIGIICSMLTSLPIILIPFITGEAIDLMIENNTDYKLILNKLVLIFILVIFYAVFRFISEYIISKETSRLTNNLRKKAFDHILKAPIAKLEQYTDGEVMDRLILDIEIAKDGINQGLNQFFSNILTIIGIIVVMFIINIYMGLLVVLLTPISLVFANIIAKGSFKAYRKSADARNKLSSYTEEMIQNQKLIKSLNYEDGIIESFSNYNNEYRKSGFKSVIYASFLNPITRLINGIIYIAVGFLGAIIILKSNSDTLTIGMLSSFLVYAISYTKPFNEVSAVLSQIQQAFTSIARVDKILSIGENENGIEKIETFNGDIEVDGLSFSYDGQKNVLKNISFNVKQGEKIAVVGQTGSGKTTLIQVLMRFYLYHYGSIKISGKEIKNLDKMNLRQYMGIVLQDAWLFKGTVFENIAYAKENATSKEVINAAKSVYADDFIKRLEHGYDTIISDEKTISLGEKQLIAIARIMLLDPPLLILDEATSNIDALTEINIQKAFDKLMKNKTSIIIAHRLQTIKEADKILVMDQGEIVEFGTHDELINKKGKYYQIYESQFRAL